MDNISSIHNYYHGLLHGEQISYYSNGNVKWNNYHHAKSNGYQARFNPDSSILFKRYWDMNKYIYEEDHLV